jgi:hypothetical protein
MEAISKDLMESTGMKLNASELHFARQRVVNVNNREGEDHVVEAILPFFAIYDYETPWSFLTLFRFWH